MIRGSGAFYLVEFANQMSEKEDVRDQMLVEDVGLSEALNTDMCDL